LAHHMVASAVDFDPERDFASIFLTDMPSQPDESSVSHPGHSVVLEDPDYENFLSDFA